MSLDLLNAGYGVLNPVSSTDENEVFHDTEEATFLDKVQKTVNKNLGYNESRELGRMIGICLRYEGKTKGVTGTQTDWYSMTKALEGSSEREAPKLHQIRVRIPELHAALPIPSTLPGQAESSIDHGIINLYPIFTAVNSEMQAPTAGSLVWVDFQNKVKEQNGQYFGPVNSRDVGSIRAAAAGDARGYGAGAGTPTTTPPPTGSASLYPNPTEIPLAGPGYVFKPSARSRRSNFAQREVAATIQWIASEYLNRTGDVLVFGDVSTERGGRLARHTSHRTGEDVDIGVPSTNPRGVGRWATKSNAKDYLKVANMEALMDIFNQLTIDENSVGTFIPEAVYSNTESSIRSRGHVPIELIILAKSIGKQLFLADGVPIGGTHSYVGNPAGIQRRDKRFGKINSSIAESGTDHQDHVHIRFLTPS